MDPSASPEVVLVFLDDEEEKLYQLKQWVQPLERLGRKLSVGVWYMSDHAGEVLAATGLRSVRLGGLAELNRHLREHRPKVMLYANQSVKNFHTLRDGRCVHVFISHGESDKAYMYQNTLKRFDLCFAAGEAAIRRISRNISGYDVAARVRTIGRPQILDHHEVPAEVPESGLVRVLYAPTWEGVTRATRYSSIHTHGYELVGSLIADGGFQVVYRPHPLAGTKDSEIRQADQRIRHLIDASNRKLATPLHHVDASPFGWQLEALDVMIADISAVAYDWLATGKALVLTRPVDKKAVLDDFLLIRKLAPLDVADAPQGPAVVRRAMEDARSPASPLTALLRHYYGERSVSDDTRFEAAVRHAMDLQRSIPLDQGEWTPADFPRRVSRPRWLHRCNIIARKTLRMAGLWNPAKAVAEVAGSGADLHLHISDPFDWASLREAARRLRARHAGRSGPVVIGTNQVTSWIYLNVFSWWCNRRTDSPDFHLVVIPVPTATACEHVFEALRPGTIFYLKHHPSNHMMLRANGVRHVLLEPESDPDFVPEHALITYDEIRTGEAGVRDLVGRLLEISRPGIRPAP